jgi:hypothetical protein
MLEVQKFLAVNNHSVSMWVGEGGEHLHVVYLSVSSGDHARLESGTPFRF